MTGVPAAADAEFDVFVSYSRDDAAFAGLLARTLAAYAPPKGLGLPTRRLRVFRDESDIRGSEYFASIDGFLRRSRKLLLICSPSARRSRFVNDEVQRFVDARGATHVIPILLAGIPNNEMAPGQEDLQAFPDALCAAMRLPLAVTYRGFDVARNRPHKGAYDSSWYTTLANIFEVSRAEIEERDKKRKRRNRALVSAFGVAIIAVLTVALIFTVLARNNEALQRQRAEAALQRASARLLTLHARDQAGQSAPLTLLLSAAAVEATTGQNYVESATEELLRSLLAQMDGRPMASPDSGERPMLDDISPDRGWALASGPAKHPVLWRFGPAGQVEEQVTLEAISSFDVLRFGPSSKFLIWAESPLTAKSASNESGGHVTLVPLVSAGRRATWTRLAIRNRDERIHGIQFSPDGRLMLLTTDYPRNRPAHLYRLIDDGAGIAELTLPIPPGETGPPEAWTFSPDGRWLVASQMPRQSIVWRLADGHVTGPHTLTSAAEGGDRFVTFSGDGTWLATYGYSPTARLWRLGDGNPERAPVDLPVGGEAYVETVRFSPDGRFVVAAPCVWRLGAPRPTKVACVPVSRHYFSSGDDLGFTADGHRLIAIGGESELTASIWDLTAANPRTSSALTFTEAVEVSADRRWLIETPAGHSARIWDLRDGPLTAAAAISVEGPAVLAAAFAHDGTTLATAHADGSLRIHSLEGRCCSVPTVVRASGVPANRLQFSPHDGWLVAQSYAGWPGFVRRDAPTLVRLTKGEPPVVSRLGDDTLEFPRPADTEFEFSADDDRLIGRQTSSTIAYLWDLRAQPVDGSRRLLKGHEGAVAYFDFLRGGTLITTQLYDRLGMGPYRAYPRLWEPVGRSAPHPDTRIKWSAFNQRSDALAAIGEKGTLLLYRPQTDGTLQEVFRASEMGGGVTNRRPVGGYARPQRPQFAPRFDRSGRWLVVASEAGRLTVVDCAPATPKAYQLADALGASFFVAMVGDQPLLVSSVDGRTNQLDVWDLSGASPRSLRRLNPAWAAELDASDPPEMAVALVSDNQLAIAAPSKAAGRSEIWRYSLSAGTAARVADLPTDQAMDSSGDGAVVAGSESVYDGRTNATYRLEGFIPQPALKDQSAMQTRFQYRVSPDGRWAVGRRFTIEGYAEMGRRSHYAWRHVFDLASRDPLHAVLTLPEVDTAVFAEFTPDSSHWVAVSKEGRVTIVTLPPRGMPLVTAKKIDQYFSGRAVGSGFWPTGETSYEVSTSARGDWLATRRGDLLYLIRLQEPFDGKLLRGFEAERGLSRVDTSFSPNDDLAMIGSRFWRTRVEADLLGPVRLGEEILAASASGEWFVTQSAAGVSLHPVDVRRLVQRARTLAGRALTADEREQFLLPAPSPKN